MIKTKTCTTCSKKLKGRQLMFCSTICKNKAHQSYGAQKTRGLSRKIEIVKKFGGKCSVCGYSKNLAALTFHHIDPKFKKFKLDMRSLSNRTTSSIDDELKKCKLVCHNCHAEIHNPQHDLAFIHLSRLL